MPSGVNSMHIFQKNLYVTILLWISGTVTFDMMEREKMIFIPITDDDTPELSEFFTVVLTKTVGGARLTSKNKKVIEILGNDYANGLFRCVIIIWLPSSLNISLISKKLIYISPTHLSWVKSMRVNSNWENYLQYSWNHFRPIDNSSAFWFQLSTFVNLFCSPIRDHQRGILNFTNIKSSRSIDVHPAHMRVEEGGLVEIPVVRHGGAFGMVNVTWKCVGMDADVVHSQGVLNFKVCCMQIRSSF